jgi:hypothetical protein
VRVLYFLEDRAQDAFIKALVIKIAKQESIPSGQLIHEIRSARGGSRVKVDFRKFVKDTAKSTADDVDLLVVAVDGNCKGHKEQIRNLERYIKPNHPFRNKVVYAIPDPHIERWYIMDQRAFKEGVGIARAPELPGYKRQKGYYKSILNQTLKEADVNSLLGGAEYGERIVESIENLDAFSKQDDGLQDFVNELRIKMRNWKRNN